MSNKGNKPRKLVKSIVSVHRDLVKKDLAREKKALAKLAKAQLGDKDVKN